MEVRARGNYGVQAPGRRKSRLRRKKWTTGQQTVSERCSSRAVVGPFLPAHRAEAGGGVRALAARTGRRGERTQGPRPGPSHGAAPSLTTGQLDGQAVSVHLQSQTGPKRGQSNQRKQILLETS